MKREIKYEILPLAIALAASTQLPAQDGVFATRPQETEAARLLTMEESELGNHLKPADMSIIWRPGTSMLTVFENGSLTGRKPLEGTVEVILAADDIRTAAEGKEAAFEGWLDSTHAVFKTGRTYIIMDTEGKRCTGKVTLPEGAASLTINPAGNHPYTSGNSLYFCDNSGNSYPIAVSEDSNIIYGQTVSRNEFGISGGIFLSGTGKKVAFYRKDESAVGTFPLLDINSRTGSLREIKYPMAGMASENVRIGIYDFAAGTTVWLGCDDFGHDQYLTGVTWSPDGNHILVQVLDRSQKHLRLNMYDSSTGRYVRTILTEDNDRYVEPQDPVWFLEGSDDTFIYRTDNRDGYRNLYLCDFDGNVRRLTQTDADVAYIGNDGKTYITPLPKSPRWRTICSGSG